MEGEDAEWGGARLAVDHARLHLLLCEGGLAATLVALVPDEYVLVRVLVAARATHHGCNVV